MINDYDNIYYRQKVIKKLNKYSKNANTIIKQKLDELISYLGDDFSSNDYKKTDISYINMPLCIYINFGLYNFHYQMRKNTSKLMEFIDNHSLTYHMNCIRQTREESFLSIKYLYDNYLNKRPICSYYDEHMTLWDKCNINYYNVYITLKEIEDWYDTYRYTTMESNYKSNKFAKHCFITYGENWAYLH